MTFEELIKCLNGLTKLKVTQSEIAKALDLTRSTVSIRTKDKSELKKTELEKIAKHFQVSLDYLLLSDIAKTGDILNSEDSFIDIPVRGEVEASMGYGVTVYSEQQTATYAISRKLARDLGINSSQSEMIYARGNSMLPTIESGDSLLVDHSKKEIYDGKIYCVRLDGQLYAKRLQKLTNRKIKIISDNKDYEPVVVDFDKNENYDFAVIGEIRWIGRVLL